jgi:hypothetical protein
MTASQKFRFSGHETFACRYAWLPKAAREVCRDQLIFLSTKEDEAMVELGVGKNMVRSIRFWAEATEVIVPCEDGHVPTEFGTQIFLGTHNELTDSFEDGFDPFLEDIQTLWLLHWKLATNIDNPIFAWDFLLSRFQEPELTASSVFDAVKKATISLDKALSDSTIEQQFEIFLHSYVPTRGRKGEVREDNLDCPLVELGLLDQVGHRPGKRNAGRPEPIYAFRREPKPDISPMLFAYCVDEFWRLRHPGEKTLSFQLLSSGHGSPGQVFKLPEDDIHRRAESLSLDTDGFFDFRESASISSLVRKNHNQTLPLSAIYEAVPTYA